MKNFKKLSGLMLVLVMVFALAAPAFAAEDAQTVTVTITLQQATNPSNVATVNGLTDVTPIATDLSVTVTKEGTVYAYDVVKALADQNTGVSNIVWKDVDILGPAPGYEPTGAIGKVLQSLTYATRPRPTVYANKVTESTGDAQHGTYAGYAWEYFVNGAYVSDYMSQQPVSTGDTIVLSYDYSSFSW